MSLGWFFAALFLLAAGAWGVAWRAVGQNDDLRDQLSASERDNERLRAERNHWRQPTGYWPPPPMPVNPAASNDVTIQFDRTAT
jgi:hypothetical protein